MAAKVKLFGLPRTATNAVEWLLRHNLSGAELLTNENSGSKHSLACFQYMSKKPDVLVLVAKNPYAWLRSMYRWVRKQPATRYIFSKGFSAFIRSEFAYPGVIGKTFWPTPVETWNCMNAHWLSLIPEPHVIRQDDLLTKGDAARTVAAFTRKYGLKLTASFAYTNKSVSPQQELAKGRVASELYRKGLYMEDFTCEDRQFVRNALWPDVAARLGYASCVSAL